MEMCISFSKNRVCRFSRVRLMRCEQEIQISKDEDGKRLKNDPFLCTTINFNFTLYYSLERY